MAAVLILDSASQPGFVLTEEVEREKPRHRRDGSGVSPATASTSAAGTVIRTVFYGQPRRIRTGSAASSEWSAALPAAPTPPAGFR